LPLRRGVIKRKLEERGKGDREAFNFFDRNKDGKVNPAEFKRALEGLNLGITTEDATVIFEQCRAEAKVATATATATGRSANGHDGNTLYAPMCALAGAKPGEYLGGVGEGHAPPTEHLSLLTTRDRVARAVTAKVGASGGSNARDNRGDENGRGGNGGGGGGGGMDYRQFRAAFMTPDVVTAQNQTRGGGNAMDGVVNETRKLTPAEVYAATFTGREKSGGGGRGGAVQVASS
jgi:hypothetical protein